MKHYIIRNLLLFLALTFAVPANALDHPKAVLPSLASDRFTLVESGRPVPILVSQTEDKAVLRAADNLVMDFERVTGNKPQISDKVSSGSVIIIGSLDSPYVKEMVGRGKFSTAELEGRNEKYLIQTVMEPLEGIAEALVIAGSDRRGVVYGIYEISEQIGVSPWYDWMDVPVARQQNLSIARGSYTAGEPAVRYRGIFLNDEAP